MNDKQYDTPPGPDWRCSFGGLPFGFIKRWLYCSWAHRWQWVTTNELGGHRRVKVSARCYPHVWHANCEYWHCVTCHPCDEGLREAFK